MPTKTQEKTLNAKDVQRFFDDSYREVEILSDGRVRETSRNGHDPEDEITRTLKTKRTWYGAEGLQASGGGHTLVAPVTWIATAAAS